MKTTNQDSVLENALENGRSAVRVLSLAVAATLLVVGLASCDGGTGTTKVTESQTVTPPAGVAASAVDGVKDTAERLGMSPHAQSQPMADPHGQPSASPHAASSAPFGYTTPDGWEKLAPTSMRVANFKIGEAQCYVTVLSGTGGGVLENVNRWRGQVGAVGISETELAALPQIDMLGAKATFVEAAGDFTGMDASTQAASKLLGTVCVLPEQAVFVKMTGPESVVTAEKANFLAFCESLMPVGMPAGHPAIAND